MAVKFNISLLGWAFAPELIIQPGGASPEESAMSPDGLSLDFIPAALRRRCSSFSKVTLAVAHAALKRASVTEPTASVFASLHGEAAITKNLLDDLAGGQQLSPMGFSLSVHNAASGLFSIATGNKSPSTALAAGQGTFLMGLCEALMILFDGREERVLFVCSDDLVPPEFLPRAATQPAPAALAMVLGSSPGNSRLYIKC